MRTCWILLTRFVPVTARVSPAGYFRDLARRWQVDPVVTDVRVGLQIPFEASEEGCGPGTFARSCEVVHDPFCND